MKRLSSSFVVLLALCPLLSSQDVPSEVVEEEILTEEGDEAEEEDARLDAGLLSGLKLRGIGPALMSGGSPTS